MHVDLCLAVLYQQNRREESNSQTTYVLLIQNLCCDLLDGRKTIVAKLAALGHCVRLL